MDHVEAEHPSAVCLRNKDAESSTGNAHTGSRARPKQRTGNAQSGRWAIISWYENSSRSVAWMTPSRTSTFPKAFDWKRQTSCRAH